VSEAVLRQAYEILTEQELKDVVFSDVRGYEGLRSCEIVINEMPIRLAVVNGLANAKKVLEDMRAGKVHYHLVEVMACPGGCIGGAGQPITNVNRHVRYEREQDSTEMTRDCLCISHSRILQSPLCMRTG